MRGNRAPSYARLSPRGVAARRPKVKPEDLRNPTIWFVLALVIEQPSYGYEISQRFDRRFGLLVRVSHPRVYSALERLRELKLIEPAPIKLGKPVTPQQSMRHSYRVTAAGVEAYRTWVGQALGDDSERPRLVGPIVAAGLLGIDVLLDAIDQFEARCRKELRGLDGGPALAEDSHLADIAQQLIADQRRRELEARRDWAVDAREVLLERYEPRSQSRARRPAARSPRKR